MKKTPLMKILLQLIKKNKIAKLEKKQKNNTIVIMYQFVFYSCFILKLIINVIYVQMKHKIRKSVIRKYITY